VLPSRSVVTPEFIAESVEEFDPFCTTAPSPKVLPPLWTWFQTQAQATMNRTTRSTVMKIRLTTFYLSLLSGDQCGAYSSQVAGSLVNPAEVHQLHQTNEARGGAQ